MAGGTGAALTRLDAVELVNRAAPDDAEIAGLILRLFNLDDQVVFQTNLTNPGPGRTLADPLAGGDHGAVALDRLARRQTNGAGNYPRRPG